MEYDTTLAAQYAGTKLDSLDQPRASRHAGAGREE